MTVKNVHIWGKQHFCLVERHITVKDGRLWWLKNETMATQVVNGDLSDASPKHSLELRFVKSIETGVAGNVFTTKAQNGDDSLNPDVCVSIASEVTLMILLKT